MPLEHDRRLTLHSLSREEGSGAEGRGYMETHWARSTSICLPWPGLDWLGLEGPKHARPWSLWQGQSWGGEVGLSDHCRLALAIPSSLFLRSQD